ncbi:hypothetical protein ACXC9Q_14950 [Kribbella sp. CWNU-51]
MLIALLALLGVNLIVIVVLLGFVLARKRWVDRQPGAFRGAIRLADGQLDGIAPKWRRGYGRWVRDVFVWTKAPFLFRNELLAADGVEEQRTAAPGEVKRLGDNPAVMRLKVGSASVEVATPAGQEERLLGPFR